MTKHEVDLVLGSIILLLLAIGILWPHESEEDDDFEDWY